MRKDTTIDTIANQNTAWGEDEVKRFIDGYVTELLISSAYTLEGDTTARLTHAQPSDIHPDSWPTIYAECGQFLQATQGTIRACVKGEKYFYDAGVAFLRTRNVAKTLTFAEICTQQAVWLTEQAQKFGPVIALSYGGWIHVQER